MNTPIKAEQFIQICVVVKDIELAANKWADLLNVEVPKIRVSHLEGNDDYTYRGEKISCDLKVAAIEMGNFAIELHQPILGESSFQEFKDNHKYGVHHIGFEVGDKRDDIINELEQDGYEMRTVGYYPGSSWTIVDSEKELGVNLNIKPIR